MMKTRKIGSLGVINGDGKLAGLITHASILEALLSQGARPEQPISRSGFEIPHTIDANAPLWQAEEIQQNQGLKYLVVMEEGEPVGMISQTDIVRGLSTCAQQNTLLKRAQEGSGLPELAAIYARIEEAAAEALEYNRRASSAVRVLSETHLAINRRCVELTLQEVQEQFGPPPLPYALIIMGSGGRKEMMLEPDQDNGIILADSPLRDNPKVRAWFKHFSGRVNENLARVGYLLCPGEIMARNPQFQMSLSEWKDQVSQMARFPNEKAALWCHIVFDFNTLFGEEDLAVQLRRHIQREVGDLHGLLKFMMAADAEGRPPIGFFNRLITPKKDNRRRIDIKRNGLRIIADAARIYAIGAGIGACNTLDRLQALVRQGILEHELVDSVMAAYEELISMLLDHQIAQRRRGEKVDKFIDPEILSAHMQEVLRESMLAVKKFQERLQGDFGLTALL